YEWILARYKGSLEWVMNHRPVTMVFSFGILAGTVVLFVLIPKGFIPSQDTGQLFVTSETAQGTSFDDMVMHQKQVDEILKADSNIAGFYSAVGGSSMITGTNQGRMLIGLKPRDQRVSVDEMIKELRPKLAKVPGIVVYMQNPPPIQIGG